MIKYSGKLRTDRCKVKLMSQNDMSGGPSRCSAKRVYVQRKKLDMLSVIIEDANEDVVVQPIVDV